MINPLIEPFLPKILPLLKKHHIRSAFLFGSVVTNHFKDTSDVDILVNLNDGLDPVEAGGHLWDLTYELETLLNRKIDLIYEGSLKNPYFINALNASKILIYGSKIA